MMDIKKQKENWGNVLEKALINYNNINVDNYIKHLSLSSCSDKIVLIPGGDEGESQYWRNNNHLLGTITIIMYRYDEPINFRFDGDTGYKLCNSIDMINSTERVYKNILDKFKQFKAMTYQEIMGFDNKYCHSYHEIYFINNSRYDVDINIEFIYGKYEILVNHDSCKFIVKDIDLSKAINDMIDKLEIYLKSIDIALRLLELR